MIIKTKSAVKPWFSFHPNSLNPVAKPNKIDRLSLIMGKMAARMTQPAAFIWGSAAVCLLSFSFYLENLSFM